MDEQFCGEKVRQNAHLNFLPIWSPDVLKMQSKQFKINMPTK